MAKKLKIEVKETKRLLRVDLSPDELLAAGKLQADKSIEYAAIEADKKRTVADFTAKLATIESEVAVLANKISTGYEYRDVTCEERLGDPKPDQKTIFRTDTGECLGVEPLTAAEMQRELLAAGQPAEKAA